MKKGILAVATGLLLGMLMLAGCGKNGRKERGFRKISVLK